jgi:hypothetical protein
VYGGWIVALIGAILCAVGWYGVSGEKYEAKQIPYLASATVPGAALIIAGAVLIAARWRDDGAADPALRRQVAELHALIVEPAGEPAGGEGRSEGGGHPATPGREPAVGPAAAPGPAADAGVAAGEPRFVALPGGARYHRPECELVRDKPGVFVLAPGKAAELDLRACGLCDPDETGLRPAAAPPDDSD